MIKLKNLKIRLHDKNVQTDILKTVQNNIFTRKIVNLSEKYWNAFVADEGRDNPNVPYYYHTNTARHNKSNYGVHDRSPKQIR